jgi:putative transposase
MRFRLIDAAKKEFPVQRLGKVLGVSQSGYFAWKDRPACRRQNEDMVLLAHIRSAFALSNATYGSPRMTRELRDDAPSPNPYAQNMIKDIIIYSEAQLAASLFE